MERSAIRDSASRDQEPRTTLRPSGPRELRQLIQRWNLADIDRAEHHGAVDELQGEAARLLALERALGADRIDAGGDAGIGVLLDHLAEAGNGAVERAEEIVEVL